ncbi:MAG: MBL fold metallo-hydrolase [Fimbriimonas sp.]|nr:MBL fold metallo-hydrolase [Fimbriimonas sp.]
MNIRLLGTGAADGIPGFFGNDSVSRFARENGGKEIRSRTAAIVDGVMKIDFPPDTLNQLQRDSLDALDWTALVFTHSDDDHIAVNELQYALIPFTDLDHLPYTIYANRVICDEILGRYPDWPIELIETHSFESFSHGPYRVVPIKATHIDEEDCQNLIIERDGKRLLYATDTGIWPSETFEFLKGFVLDLLVIECTDGFNESVYKGHLNIESVIQVVESLRTEGVLTPESRVVTTHHGHHGDARHCDLERALLPHRIEPGFDGMLIEI